MILRIIIPLKEDPGVRDAIHIIGELGALVKLVETALPNPNVILQIHYGIYALPTHTQFKHF